VVTSRPQILADPLTDQPVPPATAMRIPTRTWPPARIRRRSGTNPIRAIISSLTRFRVRSGPVGTAGIRYR
jgi:hypothetical protein